MGNLPYEYSIRKIELPTTPRIGPSHFYDVHPRLRPSLPDPDDERILEVAVQCGGIIVTHNTKDFAGAEHFGISVQTPAEFLKILREEQ